VDAFFGPDLLRESRLSFGFVRIADNEWSRNTIVVWPIFAATVALGVQFWLLKTFLRIVWTNQRLADDAEERSYLTRSLLTLARQRDVKDEVTKGILHRVLTILFRPANTGDASDDGPPNDPAAVLKATAELIEKAKA